MFCLQLLLLGPPLNSHFVCQRSDNDITKLNYVQLHEQSHANRVQYNALIKILENQIVNRHMTLHTHMHAGNHTQTHPHTRTPRRTQAHTQLQPWSHKRWTIFHEYVKRIMSRSS